MSKPRLIEVAEVINETAKAILVRIEPTDSVLGMLDNDEQWIPKSQITEDSEVTGINDRGNLVITQWFAEKLGIW